MISEATASNYLTNNPIFPQQALNINFGLSNFSLTANADQGFNSSVSLRFKQEFEIDTIAAKAGFTVTMSKNSDSDQASVSVDFNIPDALATYIFFGDSEQNVEQKILEQLNPNQPTPQTAQMPLNLFSVNFSENLPGQIIMRNVKSNGGQTIPEPLTILGAGTAIGFGTFFKRQLNSKKEKTKVS